MSGFNGLVSVALVEGKVVSCRVLAVWHWLLWWCTEELRKKNVEISCIQLSCLHDLLGPYYFGFKMGVRNVEK